MKVTFKTIVMTFCLCTVAFLSKTMAQDVDVYVVGHEENSSYVPSARVWKNGVATNLANGREARAVFVSGNDVYVAGIGDNFEGVVWKNGTVIHTITDGDHRTITSVFVDGNDVYAAGYYRTNSSGTRETARIWKNGTATNLVGQHSSVEPGIPTVLVSNGDMYAGTSAYNNNKSATIWKNGTPTPIGVVSKSFLNSIFVVGEDVYAAGNSSVSAFSTGPVLWKNGAETKLNGTDAGEAYSVFVSGQDVYVTGNAYGQGTNGRATLWKNGQATYLTAGTTFATGRSVFVFGNDVYIAGYESKDGGIYVAKVWRNNEVMTLTNGQTPAYAVAVVVVPKNTDIEKVEKANYVSVYPNPVQNELKINVDESLEVHRIQICDVLGRQIADCSVENGITTDVSAFPEGVYFVKIFTQKGVVVKKFVKE